MIHRSIRATRAEKRRPFPGDRLIPEPIGSLTHAITIRTAVSGVWPWLAQMGAGTRGGWYSYDWLDNARQPSATRILPQLQHPDLGTVFPALPGVTDGFIVLGLDEPRVLVLGWLSPDGTPLMTWAFVIEDAGPGSARLLVRARAGRGYRFLGLPWWLGRYFITAVHFVMERKQLLGIARRAEARPPGGEDRPDTRGRRNAA